MSNNEFSHTVMPKEDEQAHAQQTSQGAPGIHIPTNANEINELRQPRKEDAQSLNDRMKAQGHGAAAKVADWKDEPMEKKKQEFKQKAEETKADLRDQKGDAKDVREHNQNKNSGATTSESAKGTLANAAEKVSDAAEGVRQKFSQN